jgi:hypothetical protein
LKSASIIGSIILLFGSMALAETVTVTYSGTINNFSNIPGINVGDSFTGGFTSDPIVACATAGTPFCVYGLIGNGDGQFVDVDGYHFVLNPVDDGLEATVYDGPNVLPDDPNVDLM